MTHPLHNPLRSLLSRVCLAMLIGLFVPVVGSAEIDMKVRVGNSLKRVEIKLLGGGDLFDERNRRVKTLRADETFVWEAPSFEREEKAGESGKGTRKGRQARRPPAKKKSSPWAGKRIRFVPRRGQVTVSRSSYRGQIQVSFGKDGAVVVNLLKLDEYIRGVVGREMGSLSPLESLKAQAVMARTWAVSNRGKHGKEGFDVCNAEHCQVYGGMAAERASTNAAVEATRGVIMTADGYPTSVMYHATCGGATEDNDLVYGGKPLHYLRGVKCNFCRDGTNYRWVRRLPVDVVQRRLAAEKMPFRTLKQAVVKSIPGKDRADRVILDTDRGSYSMKATVFRRVFVLPSTYFWLATASLPLERRQPVEVPMKARVDRSASTEIPPIVPAEEVLALLTGRRDGGPKQLVIQTATGLRRATRPGEGWMLMAARPGHPLAPLSRPSGVGNTGREPLETARSAKMTQTGLRSASTRLTEIALQGRGYGHQVGMCQAGAIAQGRLGWNYRQILGYYFKKVALRRLP